MYQKLNSLTDPESAAGHPAACEQAHLVILLLVLLSGIGWYVTHHQAEAVTATTGEDGAPATPPPGAPHRFAPQGTFFLLEYVSTRTAHGVAGFEPGCEVHLKSVNVAKRSMLVTDGKNTVEVHPEMITNDLDIASLTRWQDQRSQQAISAYQFSQQQAYQEAVDKVGIEHGNRVQQINVEQAAHSGTGRSTTALDQPAQPGSIYSGGQGNPYSYFYPR